MKIFSCLIFIIIFLFIVNISTISAIKKYDLSIVGYVEYADGLGRIPIGLTDMFKNDLKINFISTRQREDTFKYIPKNIITDKNISTNVTILTDVIYYKQIPTFQLLPKNSKVKIAYSMFEASLIPLDWVNVLNKNFDCAVVPDEYLVKVYKNSGVKIPIFVLPLGIYIDKFLNYKRKTQVNKPFVFGSTVSFHARKNHELLIKSFIEEFGNSKDVLLKLNGRPYGNNENYYNCLELIKGYSNIIIVSDILSEEKYIEFMASLDCFINISKGEGFSITPRESLALGIPCIVSNNSCQKTLCDSGFVRGVESLILEPAYYKQYSNHNIGYFYNCKIEDVRNALNDVYMNYEKYLSLSNKSYEWIQQNKWSSLKPMYLNLIKPKKIILGNKNSLTKYYLMTNSKKLYKKYSTLHK